VTQLIGQPVPGHESDENETRAVFTSGAGISVAMRGALQEKGLPVVAIEDMPLLAG
jgi:glutamate racemase